MTLTTTNNRKDYVGNGVQTVFAYDFLLLKGTDMEVRVDGVLKTLTTDYTISGVGVPAGGNVTFITAPANAAAVLLLRVVPATQPTDYQDNSKFPAQSHEDQLDRTAMMVQQHDESLGRALKFGKKSLQKDKDLDDLVALKFFRVKSDLSGIEMADVVAGTLTIPVFTAGDVPFAVGPSAFGRDAGLTWNNTTKRLTAQKLTVPGADAFFGTVADTFVPVTNDGKFQLGNMLLQFNQGEGMLLNQSGAAGVDSLILWQGFIGGILRYSSDVHRWTDTLSATERMRLTSGVLLLGTVTLGAATAGEFVQPNAKAHRAVVAAGGSTERLVEFTAADRVLLAGSGTPDIQWGKALVALGGGAAPTFGTIGGAGPATAAQNSWMRVVDSTGAAFWVPAWK